MSAVRLVLVSLFFVVILPSCGAVAPVERSASLTIVNISDMDICGVHLAPAARKSYGENRLASGRKIPAGSYQSFPLAAGRWNIRLEDCSRTVLYARRNVEIMGVRRLEFRPVEVQRRPRVGARRFAGAPSPSAPF